MTPVIVRHSTQSNLCYLLFLGLRGQGLTKQTH